MPLSIEYRIGVDTPIVGKVPRPGLAKTCPTEVPAVQDVTVKV